MKIALLIFMMVSASCSLIRNSALQVTGDMVERASYEVETEKNYEFVGKALPGNLKFLEGLYYVNPKNKQILLSLLKGYAGQAFAFDETAYLEEKLKEIDKGPAYTQAVKNYSKAIRYGIEYLNSFGMSFKELSSALKSKNGVPRYLDEHLDGDDLHDFEAIFYLAQSMGGIINMNKSDLELVSQLSLVKALFDWSCHKKPDYAYGACDIFYATYEASRPPMLGGNPQKGKELFEKAMNKWSSNALVVVNYIQSYVIPMIEEDEFEKVVPLIEKIKSDTHYVWKPSHSFDGETRGNSHLHFYNEIAFKRLSIIKKFKKDIF